MMFLLLPTFHNALLAQSPGQNSFNSPTSIAGPGGLRLIESDATITITRQGQAVLVYNKQSPPVPDGIDPVYRRSGFLHPVNTPAGKCVTATFPADHAHQHGIFSAWVKTHWNDRSIDFWNLAGRTGRVLHERVGSKFQSDRGLGFEVHLIHRAIGVPVADVLRETWKVTVLASSDDYHCFDLESIQENLTSIPLHVSKHHYGGFAVRGPMNWLQPSDRDLSLESQSLEGCKFLTDQGFDRKDGNGQPAKWVSMHGMVGGGIANITMLCHVDNPHAPQRARLHPTKPYFCFAACSEAAFVIDSQHPLCSRYRFLVTDQSPDPASLNRQWKAWCSDSADAGPLNF